MKGKLNANCDWMHRHVLQQQQAQWSGILIRHVARPHDRIQLARRTGKHAAADEMYSISSCNNSNDDNGDDANNNRRAALPRVTVRQRAVAELRWGRQHSSASPQSACCRTSRCPSTCDGRRSSWSWSQRPCDRIVRHVQSFYHNACGVLAVNKFADVNQGPDL